MINKQIYTLEECADLFPFLDTLEVEYHKPYKWMLPEMPPERFFASPESNKNVPVASESSSASRLQLSVTSPGAAGRGQECPFRFAVSPP